MRSKFRSLSDKVKTVCSSSPRGPGRSGQKCTVYIVYKTADSGSVCPEPMELFYCQINNRSVQQVVSSAGLRVICVVLHTSNVCQVVAVLLQAYNNTLTLQVIRSRRSKAATPALNHSKELLYCLAYTKIDYYQAASHRIVRLPIKANRCQYWSTRIGCYRRVESAIQERNRLI